MSAKERVEPIATLTAEKIAARIVELAEEINKDYEGQSILLIGTLKGAYIFMADLSRHLTMPTEIDFFNVSSYDGSTSTRRVTFKQPPTIDVEGKHVLLVEDIADTGHTLVRVREYIEDKNPASFRVCSLLDKPSRREVTMPPVDYLGFTIPDQFVVGYGLDYNQCYRNLPFIGELIFEK